MTYVYKRHRGQPARPITAAAELRILVLLVAGHLAAAEGAVDGGDLHRTGLFRRSLRNGRNFLRQPFLTPQENDTITEEYWARVNRAISLEGLQTPRPSTLNDPISTPTPEPWKKIFKASTKVDVVDAKDADSILSNWEHVTPQPFVPTQQIGAKLEQKMGVVPYDMQLGAHVMYSLSSKQTMTPPPSQEFVDEAFMAQCPMVMFADALHITPPRCDREYGAWSDPATGRPVLRWKNNGKGGLYMGVDSAATGDGSVKFAEYTERFSINSYLFQLHNCINVMRYSVQEEIIKVNHMAPHATSTMLEHDVSYSQAAFFYKYTIRHSNGSVVAETNLYRMDQNEVNFTMYLDEVSAGPVFAVARRQGIWQRDEWRECKFQKRAWAIEFPLATENFATIATVQDLRVAAAATVTLMAFRDEGVGHDGFQHVGQAHLYLTLVKTVFLILLAMFLFCICWIVIINQRLDERLRWFCFRLETFLLPKRPVNIRQPALRPTY